MSKLTETFGWPIEYPGDVRLDVFVDHHNVRTFPWDVAVWWNTDLAAAAETLARNKRTAGSVAPAKVVDDALRATLTGPNEQQNLDALKKIEARVPRSQVRVVDQLERAVRHVVKTNGDVTGSPAMIYDPDCGIWRSEGGIMSDGTTVASMLDWVIEQFARAMHRAADLADWLEEQVIAAIPQPPQGSSQQVMKQYAEKLKQIRETGKEAHDMARALSRKEQQTVRAMLKRRLGVAQTSWDSDTRWLILGDGVINLEEVAAGQRRLYGHHPGCMSTMSLDVKYKDAVSLNRVCEWDAGVMKVLPDPEVRRYLQKRYGAALLGNPGRVDKSMVWQYGTGDTAKSTIQECIAGSEGVFAPYSYAASAEVLMKRNGINPGAERFKAYARGKRFVIMSEINAGDKMDRAVFTSLTGGDTVEGTAKFTNSVSYKFTATIFMATNDAPQYPPGDTTFAERIHVVPFTHKLWSPTKNPEEWERATPEHRADPQWRTRVLSSPLERAAILRWVLDGLQLWGREGLGKLPAAMLEARDEFSEGADPVKELVDSLLGETGTHGPVFAILTDAEWDRRGLLNGDGMDTPTLEALINDRARELGLVKMFEDGLSATYMRAAKKMLNERGGLHKPASVRLDDGSFKTQRLWCRVVDVRGVPHEWSQGQL